MMIQDQKNFKFLREPQVATLTGLSKSTRWRLEKHEKFPKRRQLSTKSVGWLSSEIEKWMQTRTTIKTGDNYCQNNNTKAKHIYKPKKQVRIRKNK